MVAIFPSPFISQSVYMCGPLRIGACAWRVGLRFVVVDILHHQGVKGIIVNHEVLYGILLFIYSLSKFDL